MASQGFIMNVNNTGQALGGDTKPPLPKEKMMSYEEKSVGSTVFFKCEACPYMALAEDDIKFHLFTVHPDLAKTNGLADNIKISCPGCSSVFDAEETLRTHLRNHHKMGIKDVKKMVRSLVQIALKNAKLKKEYKKPDNPPPNDPQDLADVKVPQVIEIVSDVVNPNNENLPKGVAFISVDELNHMSAPNFERVDPKDVIQGASINIVYSNEASPQYMNVSNTAASSGPCNVIQVSSVTPDLISSIQPNVSTAIDNNLPSPPTKKDTDVLSHIKPHVPSTADDPATNINYSHQYIEDNTDAIDLDKKLLKCRIDGCHARLKDESNMDYHKKCHQNGKLQCPECGKICPGVDALHTHLWKIHALDMELPTCEICGFKTYKRHRLFNIHMKCHGKIRAYTCLICMKSFKNANQFSKHKLVHKKDPEPAKCPECQKEFSNEQRLKVHVKMVHEKVKPFKCSQCDYTAARKTELKLHVRSHTGDKPYACNKCSYRAADHNAMRRHKKLHTKEGVYKCQHCPFTAIQSTMFTSHVVTKHPNVNSNVHCCPYCPFKSLSKEKYVAHMTTHRDKESMKFVDLKTGNAQVKPSWTIPSEAGKVDDKAKSTETNGDSALKTVNPIPIEVFDCDSLSESMSQEYPKKYPKSCVVSKNSTSKIFSNCVIVTDLSTDETNSDCLISEASNDTLINRHQYNGQHPLQLSYDASQSNLHGFLGTSVSIEPNLLQSNSVNSVANHSQIVDSISNDILGNFPIRLPPAPQLSVRNNIMLNPVDKLSLPMNKVIKPTQILPVPASSHSPINMSNEMDGVPKKKAKISVKSNLILKGPDQVNMFHSQQKMAFKRLEDNERFGLGGPVTFNNLITTQFMQLQAEPVLSESPNDIITYAPENLLEDPVTTPVDSGLGDDAQIFNFNQQLSVNSMTMLPPAQKIQANDPSYIKLEGAIKQHTQSPCLESMCNALGTQAISREYKASPPLEDLHRSMSEIKNEVKSDSFYTMALSDTANPSIIDQYLMDNIIGEQYPSHIDLSTVVLPDLAAHDSDVIEIDDNSEDNKMLPRFDINFPLEPLYLMHNDFHFLEADMTGNVPDVPVNELNRLVGDVIPQESVEMAAEDPGKDFQKFVQGKQDPMMNTSVRPTANKINVKNIELMKN